MVTIPARFNGPTHSGNGGYVCGMLAAEHGGDVVTATLRQPPPLDTPLTWERHGPELRLITAGGAVVGEATDGELSADAPSAPTAADADAGLAAYPGFHEHPFDHCFTCGTARVEGDGLRLFTGPVEPGRTAAPWTADAAFDSGDGSVDLPVTWAALDCPGGWAADFTQQPMVLGRMTAQVVRRPEVGEPLLAGGHLVHRDGRKFSTSTTLHSLEGELLGRAEQVWIQVPAGTFA